MAFDEEERRHLDAAARRLTVEFSDELPPQIVLEQLHDTAARWEEAPVRQFVPVLAERYARDSLRVLRKQKTDA